MIKKDSRVRHSNPEIDAEKGVMIVFAVKNEFAVCGKGGYENYGANMTTYLISELKLEQK